MVLLVSGITNASIPIIYGFTTHSIYHTTSYHTISRHTLPHHNTPYHTIPNHNIPYHAIPCVDLCYLWTI